MSKQDIILLQWTEGRKGWLVRQVKIVSSNMELWFRVPSMIDLKIINIIKHTQASYLAVIHSSDYLKQHLAPISGTGSMIRVRK